MNKSMALSTIELHFCRTYLNRSGPCDKEESNPRLSPLGVTSPLVYYRRPYSRDDHTLPELRPIDRLSPPDQLPSLLSE